VIAVAAPIPDDAPVTSAVAPVKSMYGFMMPESNSNAHPTCAPDASTRRAPYNPSE
jgi:hypothetical protein